MDAMTGGVTARAEFLLELGKAYVEAYPEVGALCAFAGGSVGRGEADEYSDLDLNLYVEAPHSSTSGNALFRDEIIQIHVHPFPAPSEVEADPWNFRFLTEAHVVWDPVQRFSAFRETAIAFLRSPSGVARTLAGAREVVNLCKTWAEQTLSKGSTYEPAIAAKSAWHDAALRLSYFELGSVSIHSVLLDLVMPESSGFEVLSDLPRHAATIQLPVIILSAKEEGNRKGVGAWLESHAPTQSAGDNLQLSRIIFATAA